ncbi:MAG: SRPBCC family protein [Acidimicrobiia bacterium]|nr:SRPBCC family protein [Acidimicrobiia bacterium]
MPRLHRTITVPSSLEDAFEYVADFSRVAEWDPGVSRSSQTIEGGVGAGATYAVEAVFGTRTIPMTYTTTTFERPHRIVLRGTGATLTAIDEITFRTTAAGTAIDYVADIQLVWWMRVTEPLLHGRFQSLADEALAGLEAALS